MGFEQLPINRCFRRCESLTDPARRAGARHPACGPAAQPRCARAQRTMSARPIAPDWRAISR
ncbi:hypothetical protein, partial [Tahibacter caeni]|uniref:hypothetical protein n=1 Tax=Tahibacter caeni TaxID=1453545 RepID=UPI002147BFD0